MSTSAPAQPHSVYRPNLGGMCFGLVLILANDIFWIYVLIRNSPRWPAAVFLLVVLGLTVMTVASMRVRVTVGDGTVVVRRLSTIRRFERGRSEVSFYEHPYARHRRRWALVGTLRFTDTESGSSINVRPTMVPAQRRKQMFHDVEAALNVPIVRLPHRNFWSWQ